MRITSRKYGGCNKFLPTFVYPIGFTSVAVNYQYLFAVRLEKMEIPLKCAGHYGIGNEMEVGWEFFETLLDLFSEAGKGVTWLILLSCSQSTAEELHTYYQRAAAIPLAH